MTTENKALDAEDYFSMSDEDLLKARPPEDAPAVEQDPGQAAEAAEVVTPLEEEDENEGDEGKEAGEATPSKEKPEGGAASEAGEEGDGTAPDAAGENGAAKPKEGEQKPTDKPAEPKTPAEVVVPVDATAELNKLFAPFKANGREMQVKSVDEAVALMQMGANYNKKMAGLKPGLKILKYLENNGLMDEDKLSFFVDLNKKDPAAINKLVKDSGINPMDLDAEKAASYKRTSASVDEREIELDNVLDDLKDSKTYTKTLNVVSKEWDATSKQTIAESPQMLRIIDEHMQSGVFDLIKTEMDRQRVLGGLNGVSDIVAYRQIGDAIHAQGGFNHLGHQGKPAAAVAEVVTPKPKKLEDEALKMKRRAASGTKTAGTVAAAKEFNPLAMSDAEFSKQVKSQYL